MAMIKSRLTSMEISGVDITRHLCAYPKMEHATMVKESGFGFDFNARFFMRRMDREDPEVVAVRALERFDPEVRLLPTNTANGIGEMIRDDDSRRAAGQCLIFRLTEVIDGQARYDFAGSGF